MLPLAELAAHARTAGLMALTLFEELLRLAEGQLDAARRVDGPALSALTEERRALQDRMDWDALFQSPAAELEELREVARRLRTVDARTLACGQNVLGAIAPLLPDSTPSTYSRRGTLRRA